MHAEDLHDELCTPLTPSRLVFLCLVGVTVWIWLIVGVSVAISKIS